MPYNIRIVSTYPPRRCGIGTFSRDLASALEHFTGECGAIRISAIDKENLPYSIPVDLTINQYNPQSWKDGIKDILARASESQNPTVVLLQHEYGLDLDEQGRGDARRLLETIHEMSAGDSRSSGVVLTPETEYNLPFYEKFGYRILGEAQADELRTWTLYRRDSAI